MDITRHIQYVLSEISRYGFCKVEPFVIGTVEPEIITFCEKTGLHLGSHELYFTTQALSHALRTEKQVKGLSVEPQDLINFPETKKNMAIYYDSELRTFVYTDDKNKFIIHPNYNIKLSGKKKVVSNFITAQRLHPQECFHEKKYLPIKRRKSSI